MALRTIRIQGDPVLEKVCKPVPEVTEKIRDLIDDMIETCMRQMALDLQHRRSAF